MLTKLASKTLETLSVDEDDIHRKRKAEKGCIKYQEKVRPHSGHFRRQIKRRWALDKVQHMGKTVHKMRQTLHL